MSPNEDSPAPSAFPKIHPAIAIVFVTLLMAALTLYRLGAADVCGGNEAVEGVFVQQMVEHGKALFPRENGTVPMYKPPLFHWTALAIDRAAGITRVTAANLRFPSALYATAGTAITMLFAGDVLGADGAILAGLALAGSYQYVEEGRYGRVDMTLAFFETLALFAFVWWMPSDPGAAGARARDESNPAALYLMALAMGLGVLAKGPVGAFIPGVSILAFMIAARRARQIIAMLDPGAIILGAVVASGWYLACYVAGQTDFLHRQLGAENAGRFFGELGAMAPWYYVKPILLNSAPESLLVPIAAAAALWGRFRRAPDEPSNGNAQSPGASARRAPDAILLLAIFWVVTIGFFTIAAYKRRAYLLPLWPAAAVMIAWWTVTLPWADYRRIAIRGLATICCAAAAFNFFYIPHAEIQSCGGDSYRPAAREITRAIGPGAPLYLYGFHEEVAPLLFYLDRDAPILKGRLGDAPPGDIVVPRAVWKAHRDGASGLTPVLTSDHGSRHLVVVTRGKSLADENRSAPLLRRRYAAFAVR
ncbi:MAG: ArnT family glycosyltransferase [Candidatus Binataceae bacterium]